MGLFDLMAENGHEQVMFFRGRNGKLKSIIAFHDTTLGPALGGTRMYPYETEEEAVIDALRLSYGMTMKSAASGNHYGGGKGVIWGDPLQDKDEILLRTYGRFIEGLKGRFITGTDVGTFSHDFVHCLSETKHVVGLPVEYGGSGDTSILTAYGVFLGIRACVEELFKKSDLSGITVAVQGLGKVGSKLCRHLKNAGASLIVSDVRTGVSETLARELGARIAPPDEIVEAECDVFSPNAMGAVLNSSSIPKMKCKAVCGAANNQLEKPEDADELKARGILYAPDYIVNSGGLIQVADELEGFNQERAKRKVERIPELLKTVFRIAEEKGINTDKAASFMVLQRIQSVLELKGTYVSGS